MYKVILSAAGNPDHNENPFSNVVKGKIIKGRVAKRPTIEACRKAVIDYIDRNDLGAGNWTGGKVYNSDDEYVGYISYNGRFWNEESEYGRERYDTP